MSHPTIELPRPQGVGPDSLEDHPSLSLDERASRAAARSVLKHAASAADDQRRHLKPSAEDKHDPRQEFRGEWAVSAQNNGAAEYNGYFDWTDDSGVTHRERMDKAQVGFTSPDTGELDLWGNVNQARVRELVHAEALRDNAAFDAEKARLASRHPARRAIGKVAARIGLPKRFH